MIFLFLVRVERSTRSTDLWLCGVPWGSVKRRGGAVKKVVPLSKISSASRGDFKFYDKYPDSISLAKKYKECGCTCWPHFGQWLIMCCFNIVNYFDSKHQNRSTKHFVMAPVKCTISTPETGPGLVIYIGWILGSRWSPFRRNGDSPKMDHAFSTRNCLKSPKIWVMFFQNHPKND